MISWTVAFASAAVSRATAKALTPILTSWPVSAAFLRMSSTCLAISSGVLPLVKYQSETRDAMSRAARDEPPWKISGRGSMGFGFNE